MQPIASPTDRERHKALLGSKRTITKLNPQCGALPALRTPTLTPSSSAPRDRSQRSTSTEFLLSLDQIRIVDTQTSVRDGATLYVVETYTFVHSASNIPTVRHSSALSPPPTRQPQTSASATTTSGSVSGEQEPAERAADLCVRRRFADFARLRREAVATTCVNAHFLCQYCRQFQTYARFHAAQPIWLVRIVTTKEQRKRILARFLSDLADFAQSRAQRDRHCRLRQALPALLEQFLRD